jgi:uncharacterized protein
MGIDWLNVLMIAALWVGHAAFLVGLVNRIHGWPVSRGVLHRIRQIHDLLIVGLPPLFVWFFGLREPRVLFGGEWNAVPLPVLAYLSVCAVTFLAIPVVVLRRRLAPRVALQISNHSSEVDVAQRLGFRPIGRGPYRLLTHLPGNEFLRLQVSDKEYRLPRLPKAWDGLSILHLSDLHLTGVVDLPYFEELTRIAGAMPADLIVFTGDLLDRKELVDWLPATLGKLSAPLGCWFILGNHDWYLGNPRGIRERFEALGWKDASGQAVLLDHPGARLALGGTEVPWMGRHPDFSSVPDDAFRLLLSHTPDNIGWARRNRIDLMLAGHNHGGQVRLPVIGPVYSPSAYGTRYASGVFWEAPTLLYVSRGIGGIHPWRWNCLPELTRLVLRADSGSSC